MELIIATVCLGLSCWLGYRMGKGDELKIDARKMKFAIRSESQEAELQDKIMKKKEVNNGR